MKILQSALLTIFLTVHAYPSNNQYDNNFIMADSRNNLNYKLLKAIGIGESNLTPLLYTFVLYNQSLIVQWNQYVRQNRIPCKIANYKRGAIYEIYPPDLNYAVAILPTIKYITSIDRSSYDIGLMQVNSQNVKENGWDEVRLLYDVDYNIDKAAYLINVCRQRFHSDIAQTVECYNKGFKRSNFTYDYFERIQRNYFRN